MNVQSIQQYWQVYWRYDTKDTHTHTYTHKHTYTHIYYIYIYIYIYIYTYRVFQKDLNDLNLVYFTY